MYVYCSLLLTLKCSFLSLHRIQNKSNWWRTSHSFFFIFAHLRKYGFSEGLDFIFNFTLYSMPMENLLYIIQNYRVTVYKYINKPRIRWYGGISTYRVYNKIMQSDPKTKTSQTQKQSLSEANLFCGVYIQCEQCSINI